MAKFRKTLTRFDDYYEMLSDQVRMKAYDKAIGDAVEPGDTVVDLGSGLGVLSLMAIRAGASKVYAIEQSDSIELAKVIAAHNGALDRIEFIQDNSKRVRLKRPVDVLISETLGSFGVDENTLDFTIDARDRLLKPGGRMVPEGLGLFLAPVELPEEYRQIAFWGDVAGFDFSPARDEMLNRMKLSQVKPPALLSKAQCFQHIDLRTVTDNCLQQKLLYRLERTGTVHGLAGWFSAQLCSGVMVETSPGSPQTHWQQAFFPFRNPAQIIDGDHLEVTFAIGPKAAHSDDTVVSYDYRCTQLANDRPSSSVSVGRNDPCPCGSGNKFKRCCVAVA